jgi:uncharacterized protein
MEIEEDRIIIETKKHVRQELEGEGSGHDWWHIYRVLQNALQIGKAENANLYVVELAALLHDLGDFKFYDGDETVGPRITREWLENQGAVPNVVDQVVQIVKELSYKGAGVNTDMSTLEGKVVQDADRLDAIGAIGIARTFAYGGNKNREMHNPEVKPEMHASFEAYKNSTGPTINHFYEKLLLLKDRMQTNAGKAMANERHQYMENFLEQFFAEWDGDR